MHAEGEATRLLEAPRLLFTPAQRLLTERDFKRVMQTAGKLGGKRVSVHFVMQWLPALAPPARLGMVVGKRLAKTSVERNRIRRQVREAFRLHACARFAMDLVVRLNRKRSTEYPILRAEIVALFDALPAHRLAA